MTTKPIVVGTDGSAHALQAVEWAAREAALRGAPLRIVSVSQLLPRMHAPEQAPVIETVSTHLIKERDQALAAARSAASAAADLSVETAALGGPPAQAIARSGSAAQLLVVGSHGGGAFAAMTLGSVSRYAAVHAPCPVVVVREVAPAQHRLVVVGVRTTEDCDAALSFAYQEARLRKAALLVVHAWLSVDSHPVDDEIARDLDDMLGRWHGKYPDVEASQDLVHGHPGRVLADLSASADLVVLGRHGASDRRLPGAARVVHAVVGHAHGPVAVVPPESA